MSETMGQTISESGDLIARRPGPSVQEVLASDTNPAPAIR